MKIKRAGVDPEKADIIRTADIRYRRQTHDLIIDFPPGPIGTESVKEAVGRFELKYEAVYGRGAGFREAGVELSTFRVQAIGRTRKPSLSGSSAVGPPGPRPVTYLSPRPSAGPPLRYGNGSTCRLAIRFRAPR